MIIVGMRFHQSNWRQLVKPGDMLRAVTETNNNSQFVWQRHNTAIAVYTISDNPKKIGYIRERDLTEALCAQCLQGQGLLTLVEVEKIQEYYIKTSGIIGATASTTVTTSSHNDKIDTSSYSIPVTGYNTGSIKKEDSKMNVNSMRDQLFREVKNVAIDMQSGKFGIVSNDGISVYDNGGVSVNPLVDFGVKVPAFAMRIAVGDLSEGDIILSGTEASFFKQIAGNGYEVVTLSGEVRQIGNVTNLFFGKNTVLAVKNMFGGSGMNPMLMAMMLGDNKEGFDMKTFALMSMMGNQGDNAGMNPMLMAMMLSK